MLSQDELATRTEELRQDRRLAIFMDSLSALAQWLPEGYEQVFPSFDRDIAVVFYSDRLMFVTKREPENDEKTGRMASVLEIEVRLHSQIVAIDTTIYPDWYNDYALRGLEETDKWSQVPRPHGQVAFGVPLRWAGDDSGAFRFPVSRGYEEFDSWIDLQSLLE